MRLLWLADELRRAGLTVIEYPGWQTHYRPGDWSPRYGVVHATAAPRTQLDETQIRVVRDGRSDLPGPIANAAVDRRGRWHVLSAGRCNSTTVGTAGPYEGLGNTYALSVEGCNDNVSEPWPGVQYDAYVRGWAAWCRRLGWTAGHLVGHKEHTPGRKSDPNFDMGRFRAGVAAVLAGQGDDMALTDEDVQRIAKAVADFRWGPGLTLYSYARDAAAASTAAAVGVTALAGRAPVDTQALAAALAAPLVDALREEFDDVDDERVTNAIDAGLRRVLGGLDGAVPPAPQA